MELKFYRCEVCGNIAVKVVDQNTPIVCCGKPMQELVANSTEAATEKHIPVVEKENNNIIVKVSEVEHPMEEKHYIQFIAIQTEKTVQYVRLNPGEKPCAKFAVADDDNFVAAYEFCNLHGLWKNN